MPPADPRGQSTLLLSFLVGAASPFLRLPTAAGWRVEGQSGGVLACDNGGGRPRGAWLSPQQEADADADADEGAGGEADEQGDIMAAHSLFGD